jgi:hypothetical protein
VALELNKKVIRDESKDSQEQKDTFNKSAKGTKLAKQVNYEAHTKRGKISCSMSRQPITPRVTMNWHSCERTI